MSKIGSSEQPPCMGLRNRNTGADPRYVGELPAPAIPLLTAIAGARTFGAHRTHHQAAPGRTETRP